ncbi:DUF4158 domain-containing protein [Streptomyces sp. NPDC004838]
MPLESPTDDQAEAYGTFTVVPTRPESERFFFLDDDDREVIALWRADVHRPGMAVQICTVRCIGLGPQERAPPLRDQRRREAADRPRPAALRPDRDSGEGQC